MSQYCGFLAPRQCDLKLGDGVKCWMKDRNNEELVSDCIEDVMLGICQCFDHCCDPTLKKLFYRFAKHAIVRKLEQLCTSSDDVTRRQTKLKTEFTEEEWEYVDDPQVKWMGIRIDPSMWELVGCYKKKKKKPKVGYLC